MTLLAIETSCDETAAAALSGDGKILSSALFSQIRVHEPYGGVLPEAAARSHLEVLPSVLEKVFSEVGREAGKFDLYAATAGPGLAPALLVGVAVARGMAVGARRPFLPVNHLEGHLLSPFFPKTEIPPHIALVISGGHTLLFDVRGFRQYHLLGRTLDDAAGEAFDKVAKLLGLGYPGGPAIERAARGGDSQRFHFPRAMQNQPGWDFSFSGLKTAVRVAIEKHDAAQYLPDLCASFQEAVADALALRLTRALRFTGHPLAALSGGVSSNSRVTEKCQAAAAAEGAQLLTAPPELRTDNAAMIAHAALLGHRQLTGNHCSAQEIAPNFDPTTFPGF